MSSFKFEVWPTEYRTITQVFGANPQNYAQFGLPGHEGVDIRAPNGSKVYCVAPGRVNRVHSEPPRHNYGIHVRVSHQDGYETIYAHLQEATVREGDQVQSGTTLGLADNTGNSFGSHLHLTLKQAGAKQGNWPSNIIDPTPFLLPLMGWQAPAGPYLGGWVLSMSITIFDNLAQVHPDGATLYLAPNKSLTLPASTIMIVAGQPQRGFIPVKVSQAVAGTDDPTLPTTPTPEPPDTIAVISGWAWAEFLRRTGDQAVVSTHGINLRTEPDRSSTNIGVVQRGSTVGITGEETNSYLPVVARRADFIGAVNLPTSPPDLDQIDLAHLPEGVFLGWVVSRHLQNPAGGSVTTRHTGVALRSRPDLVAPVVGSIKGDSTVTVAGQDRHDYTPILAYRHDFISVITADLQVELPAPLTTAAASPPHPAHDSTPGWGLSGEIVRQQGKTLVGRHGLTLRLSPRRNALNRGFVPAGTVIMVTGPAVGEFTPIRVDDELLQPPVDTSPDPVTLVANPDPGSLGQARLGLHASADPAISVAEHQEFADLRPGIIKVLSFHSREDIARLAAAHPDAHWVIRAFLNFGGRDISPDQFLNDTVSDVKRALDQLQGREVVVELHNEPNLTSEGLGTSWSDGQSFGEWWLTLLKKYRLAMPGMRFIYPGLSPGSSVSGLKQDHIQFIEASRTAVTAADGLGVHLYWSNVSPLQRALDVLDDYISRFRFTPIWITEASHNKSGLTAKEKALQYLQFWHNLQTRPLVQGVTYFVAAASDPTFAEEVWVGRGIGKIVGRR